MHQADSNQCIVDSDRAIEIAPRVWWVGRVLADDPFQCHVYLIEQGNQSVLIDPGSRLTFATTLRKIEQIIPFTSIRYFVCHHQDPDITACLPLIDALIDRPDALLVTHWRCSALLHHYGLEHLPFWLVDEHDWRLALPDRELRFVFTPYAHFPGAFCTFDAETGTLFSSDLFGGFTKPPRLVAEDIGYFESMRPFHEHYIPSRDILGYALDQIERHPVKLIAPQHGSIIPEALVEPIIERLRQLDCGIYLFAEGCDTDIRRLSQLNQTLGEITRTMLYCRDFHDIAARLLEVLRRSLPVARINYYLELEGGEVIGLVEDGRLQQSAEQTPQHLRDLLGISRTCWLGNAEHGCCIHDHPLHDERFCSHITSDGSMSLMLPLFSPEDQRMEAITTVHLERPIEIGPHERQLIAQLMTPLQVALEREAIYRSIEAERTRTYQRSIRDSLTGLFNRFYMQDIIERQCHAQDRGGPRLAVLMIDLDHFKQINDRHGHTVGDTLLRQFATLLRETIRDGDVPVRFGGEEFVLFLIDATDAQARALAERLRTAVAAHHFTSETAPRLHLTVSIGIALRHPREALEALIQRADKALYSAKQDGRNRCTFTD
ncbi:diguanylate cyclase [Marichromatium purpuratum 984]|uniref:diguanylate cyclase n=1 Tax=Marichromatium purpuratum 984 TaxID=765910 RepID=W0E4G5_MARPU|nr:diguanylate cyclase [Marichromatium purpuratum]AHF04104.1 diguanylate cyclase [Marichromatium purpuratum 984]